MPYKSSDLKQARLDRLLFGAPRQNYWKSKMKFNLNKEDKMIARRTKATSIEDAPDPKIERTALTIITMTGGYYSKLARACKLIDDLVKEKMNDSK